MSIKDRFEAHPVVWGLTLLAVGSTAGFGFNETISNKMRACPKEAATKENAPTTIECNIVGLDKLVEAHNTRVSTMQNELMNLEAKASDQNLMSIDQSKYKESANRVRNDINGENQIYKDSLSLLEKKCT